MATHLLAIDQGTTGTTVMVFDSTTAVLGRGYREITQHYPQPGWVEHDAEEIWISVCTAMAEALAAAGLGAGDIAAIGITNQRETIVVWDRATGHPVHHALVWQDRRTAAACEDLRARNGVEALIRQRTGLLIDPYFSATKLRWLLDTVPGLRDRAARGEVAAGTIDSWLLWKLTAGRVHATDPSNASRTLLFDIHRGDWDGELLALFDIPPGILPSVRPSSAVLGHTDPDGPLGRALPVAGIAGDQQAALFGQACHTPGMAKATYGTGSFLLMHTGTVPVESRSALLTTVAWRLGDGPLEYALEGAVFVTGAAVQWLRDGLGLIAAAAETEDLARSVPDSGGVVFVPALTGLGAPHWDPYARGLIIGLTRGTGRAHIARATLESIALQTADVVRTMQAESGVPLRQLRADGGAVANNLLMQIQADLLDAPVVVPAVTETTALGAACLAGLAVGIWPDPGAIAATWREARRFEPALDAASRETQFRRWQRAVTRSKGWAREDDGND
ncbi:MAG: glycerol kinase [Pseudomonadota bacterium]|jgi:glycerol kinase